MAEYLRPTELSNLLNEGIPVGRQVTFDGSINTASEVVGFSVNYSGVDLGLEKIASNDLGTRYGIINHHGRQHLMTFFLRKDKPSTVNHPHDECESKIEILLGADQLLTLEARNIRY